MKIRSTLNTTRKNKGFTLIEIMVTVAIVAIFASIAVPSFTQMIKNNQISRATNEVVGGLILARSEALKRSNNVTLCASSNQTSCSGTSDFSGGWMVFLDCDDDGNFDGTGAVDCDNDGSSDDNEQLIKVSDGFEGLYVNNNVGSSVTYTFSGRSATSTFDIGKDSSNKKKKITINKVGRVKVEDY